jgi:leader peptidase (prepilin peptidase)/N-methyltransferase
MDTIAISVYGAAAGLVAWYCRAGHRVMDLVKAAGGDRPEGGASWSPAAWACSTALATGAVVASVPGHVDRALAPLVTVALAVWAAAIAILGLIDWESLVLPTKVVRLATVAAGALLAAGGVRTGDWHYFWRGAACAGLVGGLFAVWAALSPEGLGFGDVRMAFLVALGSGVFSVPASLAAVSCSSLFAGLAATCRSARGSGLKRGRVALGPFLAASGLAVVIANAI